MIEAAGHGVLLYVFPHERASVLADFKIQTAPYSGQQAVPNPGGQDLTSSESAAFSSGAGRLRDFGLGAQVLVDLGCGKIRLITNNPRRVVGASGHGLDIVECLPIRLPAKVVALREQEG